eukprot:TRINITY_DN5881_c0_g1_i1.p1 TRINITY_DN5881_c0_g1~~TRINITY_DN5881_c0_g1_i1.p1  ORF type:complete len:107 (-),score=19.70 TRINITY_DN5881_c0_g1_i1:11-331(-)
MITHEAKTVVTTARTLKPGQNVEQASRCRRAWKAYQDLLNRFAPDAFMQAHHADSLLCAQVRYSTLNLLNRATELRKVCSRKALVTRVISISRPYCRSRNAHVPAT